MDEIDKNKGNLNKMKYTYDNKEKNTLYNKIFRKIENPHFGSVSDIIDGFTIAINDTWGNMIEIVDFMLYKNQYAGKMKFTIYDHFGLNEPDVKKIYVQLAGFRAWFALQHLDKYKGKYKPFVTMITFEIPFFGVFDKL